MAAVNTYIHVVIITLDATICTPSTATVFTNWFCKDCMVSSCAKQ